MGELVGMDPTEVLGLATRLDSQADQLRSVVGAIDGVVQHLSQQWSGADASDFVSWWQQQHRPALSGAADSVAGLAISARNNVAQQDRASSAGSGVGAAPTTGATGLTSGVGRAHNPASAPKPVSSLAASAAPAAAASSAAIAAAGAGQLAFGQRVAASASSQVGQGPAAADAVYDKSTGEAPGGAWCASFADWTLQQNGVTLPGGGWATVDTWLHAAQSHTDGMTVVPASQAGPGDFVIYTDGAGHGEHIGVLTSGVGANGQFQSVQGNFGTDAAGDNPQVRIPHPGSSYSTASGSPFGGQTVFVRVSAPS